MDKVKSNALAVILPADFNTVAHDRVCKVLGEYAQTHQTEWRHFSAAWNAVAYRFASLVLADEEYRSLVGQSETPENIQRLQQALFDFFCRGVSSVESFFHSLRFVGTIVQPKDFPLSSESDLVFSPHDVEKGYIRNFPNEALTESLSSCLSNSKWKEICDQRIVLFHRGAPPRTIYIEVGASSNPLSTIPTNIKGVANNWQFDKKLDAELTSAPRHWIACALSALLDDTAKFCEKHL